MTTPRPDPHQWQLGILAGGRGRRMGQDKVWLEVEGETLLSRCRRLCSPENDVLLALGDREEAPFLDLGFVPVRDARPQAGPMAGLLALREACAAPFLVVIPCDMPLLDRPALDALVAAAVAQNADLGRFRGTKASHPLPVVLGRRTLPQLASALNEGQNKLLGWEGKLAVSALCDTPWPGAVTASAERAFLNLNAPEDLERWQRGGSVE